MTANRRFGERRRWSAFDFKGTSLTRQQSETLRYRRREFKKRELQLRECACPKVLGRIGQIQMVPTALWRGYLGSWAIRTNRP